MSIQIHDGTKPVHNDTPLHPAAAMLVHDLKYLREINFIIAYVGMDWISFLYPFHGFNITPWNPSLALGLVYWLQLGWGTAIPWFIAILLGEMLIRGLPAPLPVTIVVAATLTVGYGLLAEQMRTALGKGGDIQYRRDLVIWLAITVAGTLATAGLFITPLVVTGLIHSEDWLVALGRFWVGDCVGVLVAMPFLSLFWDPGRRSQLVTILPRWETAGYSVLCFLGPWILFSAVQDKAFQFFYLLFLPLVWAAARQGLVGAAVSAFQIQAGVLIAVHWTDLQATGLFELQLLVAILAFVGLFIGAEVEERQRISAELRQSLHLAAAGEMAAALAHELNQPLTALNAYGKAGTLLLANGDALGRLEGVVHSMVAEAHRAADVVCRLRDFFRTGTTRLDLIGLPELVESATAEFAGKAGQQDIQLVVEPLPAWTLLGDPLQLGVVLRNLLSNAFEAVADQDQGRRLVRISVHAPGPDLIELWVQDSGPGVSERLAAHLFDTFLTTKANGLGLGLSISRAIVTAHGGSLTAEPGSSGFFKLLLPREHATHADERI